MRSLRKNLCSIALLVLAIVFSFACTQLPLLSRKKSTLRIINAPTYVLIEDTGTLAAFDDKENSQMSVTWSTSTPAVLTIEATTGKYEAIANGNAIITATAYSELPIAPEDPTASEDTIIKQTASVTIIVTDVPVSAQSIQFDYSPSFLSQSRLGLFAATVSPEIHTDGQIQWSSNEPSMLDIDATTGIFHALTIGEVVVTASVGTQNAVQSHFPVIILGPADSIRTFASPTITLGSTGTFHSFISPERHISGPIQWISRDTDIIRIEDPSTGVYEARGIGETTVVAFLGEMPEMPDMDTVVDMADLESTVETFFLSQEQVITVVENPILAETISIQAPPPLLARDSGILTATITPTNYTDATIRWTSDNPFILLIDEITGKYKSIGSGEVRVSATTINQENHTITDTITLYIDNPAQSIQVTGAPSQAVGYGYTFTLDATVIPYESSLPHTGQLQWSYPEDSLSLIRTHKNSRTFMVLSRDGLDAVVNLELDSLSETIEIRTLPLVEPSMIVANTSLLRVGTGTFTVLREEGDNISQPETHSYIWTISTSGFAEDERAELSVDSLSGDFTISKEGSFALEITKQGAFPGSDEIITFGSTTVSTYAYPNLSLQLSTNGGAGATMFTSDEERPLYREGSKTIQEINLSLESTNSILSSARARGKHQSLLSINGTTTSNIDFRSNTGESNLPSLGITNESSYGWNIMYDLTQEIVSTIPTNEAKNYPVGRLVFTVASGKQWEFELIVNVDFTYIRYGL